MTLTPSSPAGKRRFQGSIVSIYIPTAWLSDSSFSGPVDPFQLEIDMGIPIGCCYRLVCPTLVKVTSTALYPKESPLATLQGKRTLPWFGDETARGNRSKGSEALALSERPGRSLGFGGGV